MNMRNVKTVTLLLLVFIALTTAVPTLTLASTVAISNTIQLIYDPNDVQNIADLPKSITVSGTLNKSEVMNQIYNTLKGKIAISSTRELNPFLPAVLASTDQMTGGTITDNYSLRVEQYYTNQARAYKAYVTSKYVTDYDNAKGSFITSNNPPSESDASYAIYNLTDPSTGTKYNLGASLKGMPVLDIQYDQGFSGTFLPRELPLPTGSTRADVDAALLKLSKILEMKPGYSYVGYDIQNTTGGGFFTTMRDGFTVLMKSTQKSGGNSDNSGGNSTPIGNVYKYSQNAVTGVKTYVENGKTYLKFPPIPKGVKFEMQAGQTSNVEATALKNGLTGEVLYNLTGSKGIDGPHELLFTIHDYLRGQKLTIFFKVTDSESNTAGNYITLTVSSSGSGETGGTGGVVEPPVGTLNMSDSELKAYVEKTAREIGDKTTLTQNKSNGNFIITYPKIPTNTVGVGQFLDDKGNVIQTTNLSTIGEVKKEYSKSKDNVYKVKILIAAKNNSGLTATFGYTVNLADDTGRPAFKYAYVLDGRLTMNISSGVGMHPSYPIVWRYQGDSQFNIIASNQGYGTVYEASSTNYTYTNDNQGSIDNFTAGFDKLFTRGTAGSTTVYDKEKRYNKDDWVIDIDIPSTLEIVATDKNGNKTPIVLKIEGDNRPLYGAMPDYFNSILVSAKQGNQTKVGDDLLLIPKGSETNLLEPFKKEIISEFGRLNTRDTSVYLDEEDVSINKTYKFPELGSYVVEFEDDNDHYYKYTIVVLPKKSNVKKFVVPETKTVGTTEFVVAEVIEDQAKTPKIAEDIELSDYYAQIGDDYYALQDVITINPDETTPIIIKKKGTKKKDQTCNVTYSGTYDVDGDNVASSDEEMLEQLKQLLIGDTSTTKEFPDVPSTRWSYPYIQAAAKEGIIKGYTDGTFKPNYEISKEEAMAIVGRVANNNTSGIFGNRGRKAIHNKGTGTTFVDATNVDAAYTRLEPERFNINNLKSPISREETAYLINKVINVPESSSATEDFPDTKGTTYANDIKSLRGLGVIDGFPNGKFLPKESVSREEFAKMLVTAVQKAQ